MTTAKYAKPDACNDADSNNRFVPGELALFLDRKGRAYLQTLTEGEEFHCHLGFIPHAEVIGQPVGGWYTTSRGHVLLGIRPTLGDYVRLMPRGPRSSTLKTWVTSSRWQTYSPARRWLRPASVPAH